MSQRWANETDYAWVEDWPQGSLGFCVTVVRGLTPTELLSRMVVDPPTGIVRANVARRWAEAQRLPYYGTSIEAAAIDDWSIAVELGGYHAALESVIRRLSKNCAAAVVYTSVNADMSLLWAVDGTIVRWFDPLLYPEMSWIGELLPEEEGLPFGLGHARSSAFACAERLTGVMLTQEFLEDREEWLAIGHIPQEENLR